MSAPERQGSKLQAGFVCSFTGLIGLILVILLCLPLTLPRLFGYQIYAITSGSMEPEIPTGSLIYVKSCSPQQLSTGDVAVFYTASDHAGADASVVTHRVVENRRDEQELVTKGDANEANDPQPVSYGRVIGRVSCHIPRLGYVLPAFTSSGGRLALVCLLAAACLLRIVGWRLQKQD